MREAAPFAALSEWSSGLVDTKLSRKVGRYHPPEVEQAITDFLETCEVELHEAATPDEADDLELDLRHRLHPRLNVSRARRRKAGS